MRISDWSSDVCSSDLLLDIEKTGMNTAFVAGLLARWAGVAPMAVSYAGMKDRHAVTRQRFSVHLPKRQAPALDTLQVEGLRVLASDWHARKLQRGALDRKSTRLKSRH